MPQRFEPALYYYYYYLKDPYIECQIFHFLKDQIMHVIVILTVSVFKFTQLPPPPQECNVRQDHISNHTGRHLLPKN